MKRILNYPGSKWSMADWIISHFPEHDVYLEPYFGSGAIFFNKKPARIETINDLDSQVINLFQIMREQPNELARLISLTPYSREEYYQSYELTEDSLENARRMLVRCWQAIGAKRSDRTGWRSCIKESGPKNTIQFSKLPEQILEVAERLKGAQIEHQPAVQLIERYNRDNVLIYCDPPYIMETRSKRMYAHEMVIDDHLKLLEAIRNHKGYLLISGYDHALYNEMLHDWERVELEVRAERGVKRTEILWMNPRAAAAQKIKQLVLL